MSTNPVNTPHKPDRLAYGIGLSFLAVLLLLNLAVAPFTPTANIVAALFIAACMGWIGSLWYNETK